MDGKRRSKANKRVAQDAALSTDGADTVGNGGLRKGVAPISKDARSRNTARSRFESAEDYARHAVAVAEDIFDGEPLDAFNSVGKYDDRTLRMKDHELRVEQFRAEIQGRTKRLPG